MNSSRAVACKLLCCALLFSGALVVRGQTLPNYAGARLYKSGPIQITADGSTVWAVNPDNDSISRLTTATGQLLEIKLPAGPRHAPKGLSVTEDGSELLVACHDSDQVLVYNSTGELQHSIPLPWGSGPLSVAISPDQKKALVTLHRAEAVALIDLPAKSAIRIFDHLFWAPMGICWTDNGNAAWINHIFAPGEHPLQTRIDFSTSEPKVSASIRITPADPRQSSRLTAPYNLAEGGYLNIRGHGAQIPPASGRDELWLPVQYHNMNQDVFRPDSTMQSAIRRINLASKKLLEQNVEKLILSAKYVHTPTGSGAYEGPGWDARVAGPIDLAFSADGKNVLLLHELSGDLVVMPANTPPIKPAGAQPLPEIKVGDRPIGLALSPSTGLAYVCNLLSRDISVVDPVARKELKRIPATPITGENFPPSVLLGAKIFHSSDDPRISKNNKVSCASCHINAEHDGRSWNFEKLPGNHGPRPVSSLLGFRLGMGPKHDTFGWGQLHRSGDRDEVQDFDHTFQNIQMGGAGFLGTNAHPELGLPNAGRSPELDALSDYLFFLDPLKRSPFREAQGKLSEAATRGATYFLGANKSAKRLDAGCAACHVPEQSFQNNNFHDVGQNRPSSEKELNTRSPAWHVNTPTLVGVWATAPYSGMNGFAEAHSAEGAMIGLLLDAAKRANNSNHHGKPSGFTPRQLRDLAEFVLSIDGNTTAREVRDVRDISPPRMQKVSVTSLGRIEVWFNETVDQPSAENLDNWKLTDATGKSVIISSALRDKSTGDRVAITAPLAPHTKYTLRVLGGISDEAGYASGGSSNTADPSDPQNTQHFAISDRLTITLGASGYENLTIPVHDTAMVSPGLSTWSHDSLWLAPSGAAPASATAFVRFGWRNLFQQLTGVNQKDQIASASFNLRPEFGSAQTVEFRRVLQNWVDPATGADWNSSATGAPTWRDSAHSTKRWNVAGAGRLGSNGESPSDYFGASDLAARVDARVNFDTLNTRVQVGGPLVTAAFQFWFANPTVDFGYAMRLAGTPTQDLKFERQESGLKDAGPVLEITYLLSGANPRLDAEQTATGLRLQWPATPAGWKVQTSKNLPGAWSELTNTPALLNSDLQVELPASSAEAFFRLSQ